MGQAEQYYTIKLNASDEANNIYILATSAIDLSSGKSISQEIVASNTSNIMNINIRATHKDFLNKIKNIVYTGKQLKNITKTLQEQFKKSFNNDGFIEETIHYIETKDSSKLGYLFEQLFIKSCGLGKYNVQVAYEKISIADLDKTSIQQSMEEPTAILEGAEGVDPVPDGMLQPTTSDIPPGVRMVQFKFLLSPVSGTAVTDLFPGSPIVVRLNQSDPKSLDVIQSMNLRLEDGSIKPLQGTIHKITHKGNESDVIVKLGENLYGKYMEEENSVKVKTSLQEPKGRIQNSSSPTSPNYQKNIEALRNDNSLFLYIMAIAALVAIGIFAIVFLA